MIVSIFKKNYFAQFILLIVLPILLWLVAFVNPPQIFLNPKTDMPLYDALIYILPQQGFLTVFLAFLLVIAQGFLANYIFTSYQLTRKTSYFPAFIYILLMSSDYRVMTMSSLLLANTFLLLTIVSFLRCYNKSEGLDEIFLSTFLLAIASLFYSPLVLMMIWIWVGLFNFKIYKWRSFFVSIFGFLTPFVVLMVYYYLTDRSNLIMTFVSDHFAILPSFDFSNQPIQIVYMVYLMLFLAIPGYLRSATVRYDQKLSIRKRVSTLLLYIIISILPFLYDLSNPTMSIIFAPVLAYMLTVFFFTIKRNIYSDLFILILAILTVVKIFVNC